MKPTPRILELFVEDLTIHSLSEIPELKDFESYEEIVSKTKNANLSWGLVYQQNVVTFFGTGIEKFIYSLCLLSPFWLSISVIALAWLAVYYYFLLAIPFIILGSLTTAPNVNSSGYFMPNRLSYSMFFVGLLISFFNWHWGIIALSYSFTNFLFVWSRNVNRQVFQSAVTQYEIAFIYYFLRGECYLKETVTKKFYRCKREVAWNSPG